MDVGTGGQGAHTPHFSKTGKKCPFSCNLVASLENFENTKINRKIHVSGDFRLSLNIFRGSMPRSALAGLHCLSSQMNTQSNFQKSCQRALNLCASHFYNASYIPG